MLKNLLKSCWSSHAIKALCRVLFSLENFITGMFTSSIRILIVLGIGVSFGQAIQQPYVMSHSETQLLAALLLVLAFVDAFIGHVITPLLERFLEVDHAG